MDKNNLKATYDQIADEYARRIYGELHHKPFDREMLQDFAEKVRGSGLVCDLGCGPGNVAPTSAIWESMSLGLTCSKE